MPRAGGGARRAGSVRDRSADPTTVVAGRPSMPKGWVQFNVGGKLFITTEATLTFVPGSSFARAVESNWSGFPVDEDGNPLIDADPVIFEHLLNFMRGYTIVPDEAQLPWLLHDAARFGLHELAASLGCSPPVADDGRSPWAFVPGPGSFQNGRVFDTSVVSTVFEVTGVGCLGVGLHTADFTVDKFQETSIGCMGVFHHPGPHTTLPDTFRRDGPLQMPLAVTLQATGAIFVNRSVTGTDIQQWASAHRWESGVRVRLEVHVYPCQTRAVVSLSTVGKNGSDQLVRPVEIAAPAADCKLQLWPAVSLRGDYSLFTLDSYFFRSDPGCAADTENSDADDQYVRRAGGGAGHQAA